MAYKILSTPQFQDALPGLETGEHSSTTPAQPWQQTENQFNERPDVMNHYRFAQNPSYGKYDTATLKGDGTYGQGFHAGTLQAAQDRMNDLGEPFKGTAPVLHVGHVDPAKMSPKMVEDMGTQWGSQHHDAYYANDSEDAGSVSSIHAVDKQGTPNNFTTWKSSVRDAIHSGSPVPQHVKDEWTQKSRGGSDMSSGLRDPSFIHVGHSSKSSFLPTIPGLTQGVKRSYGDEKRIGGGDHTSYVPQNEVDKHYAGSAQTNIIYSPNSASARTEYNPHTGTSLPPNGDEYASVTPNAKEAKKRLPVDPRRPRTYPSEA